ncbi:MAG: transcriptional regulator, MarR family [Acidimicrobiales bacterium]|nr:transcriptional regulator, MarR family [Acidimicrobiales bacterium]
MSTTTGYTVGMAGNEATSTTYPPRWLDADEQRAWRAFVETTRWLFDLLDRELKAAHDLSHDDYALLVGLSEAPDGRLRMSDLADVALESRSRLSHHVGRLEARGLVRRESCEADRRGLFAVLTPEGRALLEAAAPIHVQGVRAHFIDRLDPGQLATLTDAFVTVARHLDEVRAPCRDEAGGGCAGE